MDGYRRACRRSLEGSALAGKGRGVADLFELQPQPFCHNPLIDIGVVGQAGGQSDLRILVVELDAGTCDQFDVELTQQVCISVQQSGQQVLGSAIGPHEVFFVQGEVDAFAK